MNQLHLSKPSTSATSSSMSQKTTYRTSSADLVPSRTSVSSKTSVASARGESNKCHIFHSLTLPRFGYVEFETTEVAQSAIDALNQQTFEGRRLMVSFANNNNAPTRDRPQRDNAPQNPPSKTLFIGNMSFEMTDRDLNNLFRGIRNVIDVRVAIDRRTGQPRGFAHADFVDVKSAMDAMKVLQGKENYGRSLRVDYSYGPSTSPRNTPR